MAQRKRKHGTGSIGVRSDGRWQVRVTYPDGTRRSVYVRGQREDAEKRLHELLREIDAGVSVAPDKMTVKAYVDYWIADVLKHRVRPKTRYTYTRQMENHLNGGLATMRLTAVRPEHVQRWINGLHAKGLSARYVDQLRGILSGAFQQAMAWGMIARNPVKLTRPPKIEPVAVAPMSPADAAALLDAVRGDRLECLVAVALSLGLRKGEALGLRWDDIDFDNRVIHVRNQVVHVTGAGTKLGPLKTERSRRTIPVPVPLLDQLRHHRIAQLEERLKAKDWVDSSAVFCSRRGTLLCHATVTKWFAKKLRQANIPHMRFHDLRHGCASLLIAQGVHPRVVMEILGHSDIGTTMNLYGHVMPSMSRDALDAVSDAITKSGAN